jgi:hypothetical protein
MPITVEPLHPVIAARVTGLDLREPQDDATIAAPQRRHQQSRRPRLPRTVHHRRTADGIQPPLR